MCGIAGLFARDGSPVDPRVARAMTEALAHRGPDDAGLWHDGRIAFGHRRLAIRDLSPAGHQPMSDPSGRVTITYNGEIFNDAELRRELARDFGCTFRSTCDAETIPLAYLAWGEAAFDRLEGQFAIALWDRAEETLFLVRDGVGIKPLFYSDDGRLVRFASELKGLLADPAQRRTLSPAMLQDQDYSIHFHAWTPEDISCLIEHCIDGEGMPFDVLFAGEFNSEHEMIYILRKI